MTATLPRINDTVPLSYAYLYNLLPDGPANQWVMLTEIGTIYVRYRGVEGNQADVKIRNDQFDDAVSWWQMYIGLLEENGEYALLTEAGEIIDWSAD